MTVVPILNTAACARPQGAQPHHRQPDRPRRSLGSHGWSISRSRLAAQRACSGRAAPALASLVRAVACEEERRRAPLSLVDPHCEAPDLLVAIVRPARKLRA